MIYKIQDLNWQKKKIFFKSGYNLLRGYERQILFFFFLFFSFLTFHYNKFNILINNAWILLDSWKDFDNQISDKFQGKRR